MSKLAFNIAFASGEDLEYPARELNTHSPHTRGWQSPRFCEYPQELGLVLVRPARLTQVQLLSHQSKIATRIELFVGDGPTYQGARWKRLGYLSLDNNKRSEFQARELKSVYIDCAGSFLKLLVHRCFVNQLNIFNQVGVVAVNLLGEYVSGAPNDAHGGPPAPALAPAGGGVMDDLSFDMNLDPESAARIRQIVAAKEQAVRLEDYDAAKRLKAAEGELCGLGVQLAQLEVGKRQAVQAEDYDRAKHLKAEINSLRAQIADQLAAIESSLGPEIADQLNAQGAAQAPPLARPGQGYGTPSQGYGGPGGPGAGPPFDRQHEQHHEPSPQPYGGPVGVDGGPGGFDGGPGAGPMHMGRPGEFDQEPPGPAGYPPQHHQQQYQQPQLLQSGAGNPYGPPPQHNSPPRYAPVREAFNEDAPLPAHRHAGGIGGDGPAQYPTAGPDEFPAESKYQDEKDGPAPAKDGEPHPLEGVPNHRDLPEPEALKTSASTSAASDGALTPLTDPELLPLVGEYVVRCLTSKQWSLREAAIIKVKLMLPSLCDHPGIGAIIQPLTTVIRAGVDDKIAQVFATTLTLLEEATHEFQSAKVSHQALHRHLESTVNTLVLKLGDNQPRVREASVDLLLTLAHCSAVGCNFITHCLVKKLPKKQTGNRIWRPLATRLQLLRDLVDQFFGTAGNGGLSTDVVMNFVNSNEATSHTFSEVRDAARELTVALYRQVGSDVERYLTNLRTKQREEYEQAFQEAEDGGEGMAAGPSRARGPDGPGSGRGSTGGGGAGGAGGGQAGRGRGRGRGRGSSGADGRDAESKGPQSARTDSSEADDVYHASGDLGGSVGGGSTEDLEDRFKDQIMKQLEDNAFSVDEAHNILLMHFGSVSGDAVKDAVLSEWCAEVSSSGHSPRLKPVEEMNEQDRSEALKAVAQWLFQ